MFDVFPGYNATPMTELAMQLPMYSYGSAFVPDFNNDGVRDLMHHNHYPFSGEESRWSDPSTEKKGPRNKRMPGGCFVDFDAVLQDGGTGTFYAANGGNGFIEWADAKTQQKCFDVHSTAFLDIDGDGLKDMFLVTGGGRGVGKSEIYDNALFWGEATNSELGFQLVGGRDAALAAGLEGRSSLGNERGRHQYWLDVDGDGLLDVLFLNDERKDDSVIPGELYHNVDGRKFIKVDAMTSGLSEFASMAMVADVDGDGFARELVVPSECNPRKKGARRQNDVCSRAPRGTISVYSLDSERLLVRETINAPPKLNDLVRAVATGDFDFDGKADIAVLRNRKLTFHLSSSKERRCNKISDSRKRQTCRLELGPPDVQATLNRCGSGGTAGMRFADFNLNGRIDMLIVCKTPGLHFIYELMPNGRWQYIQNASGRTADLGSLNSENLMLGGDDFCKGVPVTNNLSLKPCMDIFKDASKCKNVKYTHQVAICSRRAKSSKIENWVSAFPPTVADMDNDGYVDIIMGHRYGSMVMLRNTFGDYSRNRFLAVQLDSAAGPAASIGAIVKLTAINMGPSGDETTTQMRVISSVSHESDSDGSMEDRLIFGLGEWGEPAELTVQWPHCCDVTVINAATEGLAGWMDSMTNPYEVAAPEDCNDGCLKQ